MPKLSSKGCDMLIAPMSNEEVKIVVMSMKSMKAY